MRISTTEFIALMAMLVATVALSIDALLPALPDIAEQLIPQKPNQAQLVLSAFIVGMALGTFFTGPLSDSFGRKKIIYFGAVIYIFSSALCIFSSNLETLVIARVLQGIGAAAPRVVSQALVRDLYSGREMARISSFIMVIFAIVPAVAPLLGAGIILISNWQSIFGLFILFALISTVWTGVRVNEPLKVEMRIPFRLQPFKIAIIEIMSLKIVRLSIVTLIFGGGILFIAILLVQQVFDQFYGSASSFPLWFAMIAVLSASASFLNSMIVMKFGMRRIVSISMYAQVISSIAMLCLYNGNLLSGNFGFVIFVFWVFGIFFQAGLTFGNLTALAMEPLGHIAGTGASVTSALSTLGSVAIAGFAGQFFNGTPSAMIISIIIFATCGAFSAHFLIRCNRCI
jgi:MFS transporter, DHA1 family, multidrug resistance protein